MSLDKFVQDGQDPKVVEKIYGKIEDILASSETVKYIAIQKKPAVTLLPDCIIISNHRIFLCEFTKLGLSTNFEIFSWKDIKDIAFKEEIFGSKVTIIPFTGENLSIDYIPKIQARKLFQLIKEALEISKQENIEPVAKIVVQPVIETPKPIVPIRDIYEKPKEDIDPIAQNSNPVIPTTPMADPVPRFQNPVVEEKIEIVIPPVVNPISFSPPATPIVEADDDITLKLKKLKSLYDKQLITQSEYESKKAEILEQL